MTAGDIPVTTGNTDQRFKWMCFVGYNLSDSLIDWDLSRSDVASDIEPGLPTEWHVDLANPKRWIFTLHRGVKWHDGSDFTADVIWNCNFCSDQKTPEFNPQQFALTRHC